MRYITKLQAADAEGSALITGFFTPKPKPGRPKKSEKRGRPKAATPSTPVDIAQPDDSNQLPQSSQKKPKPAPPRPKPKGAPRTNWSRPENAIRLQEAIVDWQTKSGQYEEGMSMGEFCACVDIPKGTFAQYVTDVSTTIDIIILSTVTDTPLGIY